MVTTTTRDMDLLRLRLVHEAQCHGTTWNEIAGALGYKDGKEAKNSVKRLARYYERVLRREQEEA